MPLFASFSLMTGVHMRNRNDHRGGTAHDRKDRSRPHGKRDKDRTTESGGRSSRDTSYGKGPARSGGKPIGKSVGKSVATHAGKSAGKISRAVIDRALGRTPRKPDGKESSTPHIASFREILCREAGIPFRDEGRGMSAEPLAAMDYAHELELKALAFERFLRIHNIDCAPGKLVQSPLPRGYRTTTKRRILIDKGTVMLASDAGKNPVIDSALEPETHRSVYRSAGRLLGERANSFFMKRVNFVILRSDGDGVALIWNLDAISGDIVRAANGIAEKIREENPHLSSAFIFFDPKRSKYYFENDHDDHAPFRMKRLFGNKFLSLSVGPHRYSFSPTVFSQVNAGVAEKMVAFLASEFASGAERFLDLYSGYGLFSCALGHLFGEIIGADYSRESIDDAIHNASRIDGFPKARFLSRRIDEGGMASILPKSRANEIAVLDPPRQGTAPGVIETLCDRRIIAAAHIFCGVDSIPSELRRWKRGGYRVAKIVPFDMFPGTTGIEVIAIIVPGRD